MSVTIVLLQRDGGRDSSKDSQPGTVVRRHCLKQGGRKGLTLSDFYMPSYVHVLPPSHTYNVDTNIH